MPEHVEEIPVDSITVPSWRVRGKVEKDQSFEEFKQSIKNHGLMHPIEVTPRGEGGFELVSGLRRLEAVKELGWKTIPAIVRQRSELERQMAEISENIHRLPYNSKETALAIAKYAKLAAILGLRGRPPALTPEQLEKAKELREKGWTYTAIAEELGVHKDTVRFHLSKPEVGIIEVKPSGVASLESQGEKMSQIETIFRQQSYETRQPQEAPTAKPVAEPVKVFKGLREVAEALKVSKDTVHRSLDVERAIGIYPALERLEMASTILEGAKLAGELDLSQEQVSSAVDLILQQKLNYKLAFWLQKVPRELWDEFIELSWDRSRSVYVIEAIAYQRLHPELSPTECCNRVISMYRKYSVRLWNHEARQAVEREAEREGLTPEQYMALTVLSSLHDKGLISDQAYAEASQITKLMDPRKNKYDLHQLLLP